MKQGWKILFGFAVFAAVLVIAYFGYSALKNNYGSSGKQSTGSQSTIAAVDFTVQDSTGKDVKLFDFKGKPMVVNFFASWCPPCKEELPDFEKMYKEYNSKGIVFMMVDLTDGERETKEIGQEFIKSNKYTFPVYYDIKQDAAKTYGISSIPDTLFIDKNGVIVGSYVGAINEKTIKSNIEKIIE